MTDLERYKTRLASLEQLGLNLDLERREEFTAANGWDLDHYEADLPGEAPGEPLEGGTFQAAQSVLREYKFPPPDLITGIFVPDEPLEKRVMLLRAQFLGLTFYFGVKVNGVTDELRDGNDGQERVWGYRYATLEGHFERGQIEFLIVKNLLSGAVQFKIDAFSKTGLIRNSIYRIGFNLFGRRLQRRFARQSLLRMQNLVAQALKSGQVVGSAPNISSAQNNPEAQDKLEELTKPSSKIGA
jgi:Domain of unknown function (DUF1990)